MPPVEEAGLPADINEFYPCTDAVHLVIGERPAIGTAGEVHGHAAFFQTLGTLSHIAGPEADVIESGSPGRVPGTVRRPFNEFDEGRPACGEDDAVVPLTEPVGHGITPLNPGRTLKILHGLLDVRDHKTHMVEGSHSPMIEHVTPDAQRLKAAARPCVPPSGDVEVRYAEWLVHLKQRQQKEAWT